MLAQTRLFPCLKDNFGVLVHDPGSGTTAAIDAPGDGKSITPPTAFWSPLAAGPGAHAPDPGAEGVLVGAV